MINNVKTSKEITVNTYKIQPFRNISSHTDTQEIKKAELKLF